MTELVERRSGVVGRALSIGAGRSSVEVTVINEDTFREVILRSATAVVRLIKNLGAVALTGATPSEGRSARAYLAVEEISDGIARLLAGKTSPDDGGDVGVLLVVGEQDRANGVQNYNGVGAYGRDVLDELISLLPEGEVLAITEVSVDFNVALTRVGVGENDSGHVGLADKSLY